MRLKSWRSLRPCLRPRADDLGSGRVERLARRPRRMAMTLVEIVAALALLSGVLVGILMATAGYTAQWSRAQKRIAAVAATDGLLKQWWRDVGRLPVDGTGTLPGEPELSWQTRRRNVNELDGLGTIVVRLEVREHGAQVGEPLLMMDLVLNEPDMR